MKLSRGYTRATLPAEMAKTRYWPCLDFTSLSPEEQTRCDKLKVVVEKYLDNARMSPVLAQQELSYEEMYRAVRRCTARHADGRLFGWRGLLKGVRVGRYRRRRAIRISEAGGKGGYAGALMQLFRQHKELQEKLDTYLLTCTPEGGGTESHVTHGAAHSQFLTLCEQAGVPEYRWPFTTSTKAKGAVRNYVIKFFKDRHDEIAEAQYGEKAVIKGRTGTGRKSRLLASFPFDVVEVDEHKAHFLGSIGLPTPSGIRYIAITRVILITVTDRRSAIVLGYHAVFKREANAQDVLQAIHNALQPWKRREFKLTGLQYDELDGFPSRQLPELARCGWGSLLLDNALAHLSDDVLGRVRDLVGCDVNYGPARHPERRPMAELVFKRLSSSGFVRLPSTTGSDPSDPHRKNPAEKACTMRLHMWAVLDLIELAIAHYNGTVSKRIHGATGLEYLEQIAQDPELGFLMPQLPPRPAHVPALDRQIITATITGNQKKGIRPRVYALHGFYTCPALAQRWDLLEETVRLHVDPDDVSTVHAFLENGEELFRLQINEAWGDQRQSLEIRNQIAGLIQQRKLKRAQNEDYLQAFLRTLKADALKQGRKGRVSVSASALAQEASKHGAPLTDELPEAANEADVRGSVRSIKPASVRKPESAPARAHGDVYQGPPLVMPVGIKAVN